MSLDEIHWILVAINLAVTFALYAMGRDWHFSAFCTLFAAGMMGK